MPIDSVMPAAPQRRPGLTLRLLSLACTALALGLPLAAATLVLRDWPAGLAALAGQAGLRVGAPTGGAAWVLAAVLALLPALCIGRALWSARACLRQLAGGDALSLAVVRQLRGFAAWGAVAGLLGLLVPTAAGLLLGGDGPRQLALRIDSHPLLFIFFCALTWQISRLLERAVAIADEHAQIV